MYAHRTSFASEQDKPLLCNPNRAGKPNCFDKREWIECCPISYFAQLWPLTSSLFITHKKRNLTSSKINISKFQFDREFEGHGFVSRRLLCATLVKQSQFIAWSIVVESVLPCQNLLVREISLTNGDTKKYYPLNSIKNYKIRIILKKSIENYKLQWAQPPTAII